MDPHDLPALVADKLPAIDVDHLAKAEDPRHPPRILLLYGALRPQSYSKKTVLEAERILQALGCETRVFDPSGLPMYDPAQADHPKVRELRDLAVWSEGMVWSSPEQHGTMTAVIKNQIDWLPLNMGGVRPTQGKTLALMQVSGGSQSFNAVNQMRIMGRWMRMITIPNQSSIPRASLEYDEDQRLPEGPFYRRVVDVMEELVKFTWLVRGRAEYLVDRYSERVESAEKASERVNLKSL
ncbi:arsenical resistance protein ArsH [Pseudooceanicola sp. MF1-13]|uniref:arsenical resistance protein ArsH n=1 Tax=Pseudooceanicola sp. MF1-13 TaxID=3379095 RepID=UPI003892AD4F